MHFYCLTRSRNFEHRQEFEEFLEEIPHKACETKELERKEKQNGHYRNRSNRSRSTGSSCVGNRDLPQKEKNRISYAIALQYISEIEKRNTKWIQQ